MISFKKNKSGNLYSPPPSFILNNFESSKLKRKLNVINFLILYSKIIIKKVAPVNIYKIASDGRSDKGSKIYGDDTIPHIRKEFVDGIISLFVIGEIIRSHKKPIK